MRAILLDFAFLAFKGLPCGRKHRDVERLVIKAYAGLFNVRLVKYA
jgi:hypothetical protein